MRNVSHDSVLETRLLFVRAFSMFNVFTPPLIARDAPVLDDSGQSAAFS
jgi:hypothetical protein